MDPIGSDQNAPWECLAVGCRHGNTFWGFFVRNHGALAVELPGVRDVVVENPQHSTALHKDSRISQIERQSIRPFIWKVSRCARFKQLRTVDSLLLKILQSNGFLHAVAGLIEVISLPQGGHDFLNLSPDAQLIHQPICLRVKADRGAQLRGEVPVDRDGPETSTKQVARRAITRRSEHIGPSAKAASHTSCAPISL